MRSIRRRLIVLASALLACQVIAMGAAPVLLYALNASTDGSELLCDCKVEPGAECPMHGGKGHDAPGKRSGTARFSPVCGDQAAAVLTMIAASGGGILSASTPVMPPATNAVSVVARADSTFDAARPPSSPPPRS